jgi:hypothetical protein
MTDETFTEPSEHERRVAQEEADGNDDPTTGEEQPTESGREVEAEQTGKRWEKMDAEDPDVMDEERDEPPPAGYNPRTG